MLAANQTLKTFSGQSSSTDTGAAVAVANSTVTGPDNLIVVEAGANATLAGPLLAASGTAGTLTALGANSSVVDIRGALSSTTTGAFIGVDPTVFTTTDFLRIIGGSLTLAGPLLTDVQGVYAVSGDFFSVQQGGTLSASATPPLLQFSNSSLIVGVPLGATGPQNPSHFFTLSGAGSSVSLGGSLASLANNSVMTVNGGPGSALIQIGPGTTLASPSTSAIMNLSGTSIIGLGTGVRGLLGTGGVLTGGGSLLRETSGSGVVSDLTVPLVDLSNTSVNLSGALVRLEGGSHLSSGAVAVTGGSLTADTLLSTDGAGNTADIHGTVLDLSNSTVTLRALSAHDQTGANTDTAVNVLALNQPTLRLSSSALSLTRVDDIVVGFGDNSGTVPTISGVALTSTGTATAPSTLNLKGTLLGLAAANVTATQPLLQLDHTTVNQTGATTDLITVLVPPGQAATTTGPLLSATNSTINTSGRLFHFNGGTLTSNSTSPLLSFDPTVVTSAAQLIQVDNGSNLNLNGGLLTAQATTFAIGNQNVNAFGLASVLDGSKVTSTASTPFFTFDASSVDSGTIVSVRRSVSPLAQSTLTLSGPLFSAINGSTLNSSSLGLGPTLGTTGGQCCSVVSVSQGSQLISTGTAPLLQVLGSTVKTGPDAQSGGSIFNLSDTFGGAPAAELVAPSSVSLAGPLLVANGSSLSALSNVLAVTRSSFLSATADPLIQLNGTTVQLGGVDPFTSANANSRLAVVSASTTTPASLSLHGPLLSATNSTVTTGQEVLGVFNGAALTDTTTAPLLSLTGGSATAGTAVAPGAGGNFISFASSSTIPLGSSVNLAGPLLSATNTTLTNGNPAANTYAFLFIGDSATVTSTTSAPLISLDGVTLAPSGGVISMRRSLSAANPTTLALAGPLFSATSSQITLLGSAFGSACCGGFSVGQAAQLSNTTTAPLIQLSNTAFNALGLPGGGGSVFTIQDTGACCGETNTLVAPAHVTLAGPLLSVSGGSVGALFNVLSLGRSTLTSTALDPLIQLSNTTVTLGGLNPFTGTTSQGRAVNLFSSATTPTSLTLKGPLFSATSTNITGTDVMFGFFDNTTLSSTSPNPLISFTGGSATAGSTFISIGSGLGLSPTVVLSGPLLFAQNATLTNGDPTLNGITFIFVAQSAHLTDTSSSALLSFDHSTVNTSGRVFTARQSLSAANPTTVTLAGPLFVATNGSTINTTSLGLGSACCGGFFVAEGGVLTSSTTAPLIQLSGGSVFNAGPDARSGGDVFTVSDFSSSSAGPVAPAAVHLSGPLLSVTNSTVSALFDILDVQRSSFSSSSTDPLIQLSGATVHVGGPNPFPLGTGSTAFGSILFASSSAGGSNAPTIVTLNGPLFQAVGSSISTNNAAIGIFNGSSLTSNGTGPFVTLDNSTLTVGPGGQHLLSVGFAGGPQGSTFSSATFNGPLLRMVNGSNANISGLAVLSEQSAPIVGTGSTITGTGGAPFIQVDGGGLTVGNPVAGLFNGSKMTLAGGLLEVTSPGVLTAPQGILEVVSGSQFVATGTTDPLAAITGGTHAVGTQQSIFNLFGVATAPDAESGLVLGTDRPLRGTALPDGTQPVATPLLQLTGATVNTSSVALIDVALLEATAPLLNLQANGSTKSVLTTTADAVDLFQGRVSALGSSVIRLDNSTLNVTGSVINVNASKLTTSGDLVNLLNGATLTVLNGPLITVSNGGFVNIGGSLLNFGGTGGNHVTVTNSLCPCSVISGIPVALQNGALAANVQITNPIKNPTLGTVTLSPNAAVAVVNGAGSKLTVAGH